MSDVREFSRPRLAAAGVVAAGAGVAAGHLVAAVSNVSASPVLAVGYGVIDRTPAEVKEWAIAHFGTQDKPILLGSITLITLLWAVLSGLVGRRLPLGAASFVAMALLALWAALTRPGATASWSIPALLTLLVTLVVFVALRRRCRLEHPDDPRAGASRRSFVGAAVGTSVLGGMALAAGQKLSAATTTAKLALPKAFRRAPAVPAGLERQLPGITPLRTPNASFYRVDTALTVPVIERQGWSLVIDGDVEHRVTFSYDDIAAMDLVEKNVTMTCVSNEVGGKYVGGATWLGVPVRDLLARAGVREARADAQVFSTSHDGFTASTPLTAMLDDRDALLAIGMNGEPLPREHGFPARLVVPGLYGMLGSTKWVTRLEVTSRDKKAYWTQRGWADDAAIKPSARIDQPQPLAQVRAGQVKIGGIAWAQRRGVGAVEVQIDGGPWRRADLGPAVNDDYWRQWMVRCVIETPGQHSVRARVTDARGVVQTEERAPLRPDGSSGIQHIVFFVE